MKGIAGVVVLYKPNETELLRNIRSYLPFVDRLYLIDNTASNSSAFLQHAGLQYEAIRYIANSCNEGVAAALNKAASLARESHYEWLLTMDQDSYFDEADIAAYVDHFMHNFYSNRSIAIVAPSTTGANRQENDRFAYAKVVTVITSGSLLQLRIWNEVGKFDEKLFIDEVDHEYCYRAFVKGYTIIRYNNILLQHSLGTKKQAGYLGAIRKTTRTLHSPQRVYFIVRNYLYVRNKYKKLLPEIFTARDAQLLTILKNNLFFSGHFWNNLKNILKACVDYRKGNFSAKI